MKTIFEFIEFKQVPNPGKTTQKWLCRNRKSGTVLTEIKYEPGWRQYISDQQEPGMIFSAGCQRDIAEFLESLNKQHKEECAARKAMGG